MCNLFCKPGLPFPPSKPVLFWIDSHSLDFVCQKLLPSFTPSRSKMAVLSQYSYIFALGLIFAFLDAWNIGANDVANSFATSVSSRSLTMKQAMCIATVMEFAGAVLVGSRVADTIRSKILSVKAFETNPSVLMLGMFCALVGSSTWLTIATKIGLPVSTT